MEQILPDGFQHPDQDALDTVHEILRTARIAALAVIDADTALPHISRIAFGVDGSGAMITLVSDLARHTARLRAAPDCALLLGPEARKGDPLNSPRLSINCRATRLDKSPALKASWLDSHPKSKLYIDFTDFNFFRFEPITAELNGGFGKAYLITPEALSIPRP